MKNIFTTIAIIATFAIATFAAETYEGYVVTNTNDTIKGDIRLISVTIDQLSIKMKETVSGKTTTFNTSKIKGYAIRISIYDRIAKQYKKAWLCYDLKAVEEATVQFGDKMAFVPRNVNGEVKVYSHYVERAANIGQTAEHFYYIEREGVVGFVRLTKANYAEVMKNAMQDEPELAEKIGTPDFGYRQIPQIALMFNKARKNRHNTNDNPEAPTTEEEVLLVLNN